MHRLSGKVAFITGAARGIGAAFAAAYAREGARVAVADIDVTAAKKTAAAIGEPSLSYTTRRDRAALHRGRCG
jgi:D-sorbitol dehydrogenase (acceptor)